jgi:hypothetical protein
MEHIRHAIEHTLRRIVREVLATSGESVARSVDRKRRRYPYATDREIANLVIADLSRRAGAAGAITGVGGAITLPATVPAGMLAS